MTINRVRLAEARTRFIDRQSDMGRSIETIRVYNGLLRRLVRDLGDIQLVNVTNKHVEGWLYGLRREHRTDQYGRTSNPGISPATFNQTLSCLRVFFKWCHGEGFMRHDPTTNIVMMTVPKKTRQRPAPATMLEMLEAATFPRDRAYIAMAMNTALRQSEILRMRIGDVDLAGGFISVVIRKTGDVDEQPITIELDRELRRWVIHYEAQIGRPLTADDYLFPATEAPLIERRINGQIQCGPRRLAPERPARRMEKAIQAVMAAVGLETRYEGTHTLRRAVARAYFDKVSATQGDVAALRETAALLHHSNLHTTERYLGMSPEKARRDKRLKGESFLPALVDTSNVIRLDGRMG